MKNKEIIQNNDLIFYYKFLNRMIDDLNLIKEFMFQIPKRSIRHQQLKYHL